MESGPWLRPSPRTKARRTKRAVVDLSADLTQNTRADFVTTSSRTFFVTLGIDDGFLETDPAEWHDDPRYVAAAGKANGITVVNDFAERGVALMETYNLTLTKDGTRGSTTCRR